MTIKIRGFAINCVRGIPYLDILLRGKNLILKGDNGTGKSSVVEAFEYFFTGDIKEISSVKGMSIKKHAPHVNYSYEDMKIDFEFNNDEVLTKTYKDNPISTMLMEDYLITAKEQKFILKRKDLLKFIIETPGNKYKAISEILGTEELDKIELELRRSREIFKEECRILILNSNEILEYISTMLNSNIVNAHDILLSLNNFLKNSKYPKLDSLENLQNYSKKNFKLAIQNNEDSILYQKMNDILFEVQKPFFNFEIDEKIQEINEIRKKLLENRREDDLRLSQLLNLGVGLIEDNELQICPLCDQSIITEDLVFTLRNRLKELEIFSNEFSKMKGNLNEIKQYLEKIDKNFKTINDKVVLIEDFNYLEPNFQTLHDLTNNLMKKIIPTDDIPDEIKKSDFKHLKQFLSEFLKNIKGKCDSKIELYDIAKKDKEAYEIFALIQEVIVKYRDFKKIEKNRKIIEQQYEIANAIFGNYSKVKKERINEIIQSLKKNIQELYNFIHLDDPHSNIDLMLDPKKRASIKLTIDSFDKSKEDPRAYISEGHLDTLGICIFLAFVYKFNKSLPLIVLDDVVTTVDANHREKLAKLLLTKFPDHQLIITTHDGIWYKQLCENQRTLGLRHKYVNNTIISWDRSCGPQFSEYKALWEKIEDNLKRGDFDVAGILSRRYLEWILKQICSHMDVKVVFKENSRYTVGELFSNAHLRMRDLCSRVVNNDPFKVGILTAFQDLISWQYMGNILSHENLEISSFPSSEIKSFAYKINNLYTQFLCPSCKGFLQYEQKYNDIRCIQPNCKDILYIKLK